jgi:hypothetical protein
VVGPEHRGQQCRFENREITLHRRSRQANGSASWTRKRTSNRARARGPANGV